MSDIPTVRICDPEKPGDFAIINAVDFREGIHELFAGEVLPEPELEPESPLPEGYTTEKLAGGYYYLFDPDGSRIDGPSNGKWQGFDGVTQAAHAHKELTDG